MKALISEFVLEIFREKYLSFLDMNLSYGNSLNKQQTSYKDGTALYVYVYEIFFKI